jgi:hypothetical protein
MMTDEERVNPSLLKERKEVKENPISVYYGSAKKELQNVCETCKKRMTCKEGNEIKMQDNLLRSAANDKTAIHSLFEEFPEDVIEKAKSNVFIVVNCIYKE